MISPSTIEKVYEAARVEEVIGDFVQLKKSGSNYKGLSPFSQERTPSFMVSPVKQIWKDFSSGKGGNVVAFLMEHEHFSYPEAIKYLARKYQIEIEETLPSPEEKELATERESLYVVSEYAQKYFERTLWESEEGKAIGLTYFRERGFTDATIKKFGLGYNPNQWEAFTQQALKDGYQLEFLDKTGLSIVKEAVDESGQGRNFDRFKGRVMFPIYSMSGRVLGFGGRILTNDKKAAKYLNSPESDIYHKSKVLYGLYQAKQAIAKTNLCYLVEGYTDVIQLHQLGVENVVASSGTALTPEQIRLIQRLTPNIVVLFDGDAAGLRASLRGIDLILEEGMNVKVCTFPDGEDPDSFARQNDYEEVVLYLTENAKDFIRFKAELLTTDAQNDPIKKAECIRDMVESISKIPDKIKREIYIKECSHIMDISEDALFSSLFQSLKNRQRQQGKREKNEKAAQTLTPIPVETEKVNPLHELENDIIRALLLFGDVETTFEDLFLKLDDKGNEAFFREKYQAKVHEKIFLDLQQDEVEFTHPHFKELYQILMHRLQQNKPLQPAALSAEINPELAQVVSDIYMHEEQYTLHNWERKNIFVKEKSQSIGQFVNETILNLRLKLIEQKKVELLQTLNNKADTHPEVLEETNNYNKLKRLLAEQLERVT